MTDNHPNFDLIIIWHGFGYPHQRCQSWESMCRVRIWQQEPTIVLFSDLNEDDTGTSITNCSENLATLVGSHFSLTEPIRWFEHYPYHNISERKKKQLMFTESVCEIFYDHDGERYCNPKWKPFDCEPFEQLVNASISMEDYKFRPTVILKTPYEQHQEDFDQGRVDARHGRLHRLNATPSYINGYRYGTEEQSLLN